MPDDQSEVIAFLSDPATHGGAAVERIDTHCAHVFLAGDTAWKIKRAVRYDYLDFSTRAKRKAVLERELSLNAPAAPTLYRRVAAIGRGTDGTLSFDEAADPVEYALEMRRFPAEDQLDRVAASGRLTDGLAAELGEAVAAYHAAAEVRREDGPALVREILEELSRVFGDLGAFIDAGAVAAFTSQAAERFTADTPFLASRADAGFVRRCHSDLHLANLVLIDGRPVPFDALEFDERLGTCDTLYDLAFLLMDLVHRGYARAANLCLNAYMDATRDHDGLALLPLFLSIRAAIRAMVAAQTAQMAGSPEDGAEANRYLADAVAYLSPPPPELVAIGGISGSGKSTLARRLAPHLGPVPGAVLIRSDSIRKQLLGAKTSTHLDASAYGQDTTRRVYGAMQELAGRVLDAGHAVILDATFLDSADRATAEDIAASRGLRFTGFWLSGHAGLFAARVAARTHDVSDATPEVVAAQAARDAGGVEWTRLDADGTADAVAKAARGALGAGR